MGYQFEHIAGVEPFAIDQGRTVDFTPGRPTPWARWASRHTSVLESFGGRLPPRRGAGGLADAGSNRRRRLSPLDRERPRLRRGTSTEEGHRRAALPPSVVKQARPN